MSNIFNDDFRDFLSALNQHEVRYILVGGFSVILHGYSRTTGDMGIWVERTAENYEHIKKAFLSFGMPVFDMTEKISFIIQIGITTIHKNDLIDAKRHAGRSKDLNDLENL